MIAQFRTICFCGHTIQVGQEIVRVDDEWQHAACARQAASAVNVCPTCHMTTPCECE